MKKTTWVLFVFFAISVGIYPILYLLLDMSKGLLATKPPGLLNDPLWSLAFHVHIGFGGLAMLTGWSQFGRKLRNKRIMLHRNLGKVYVVSCLLSGMGGLYISFYATGGLVTAFGFGALAVLWLLTTSKAYFSIRSRNIEEHQRWMIRSYALTFAAVTLRIWLPAMQISGIEFLLAYRIVSWLCWVPNLLFAEWRIRKTKTLAPA